MPRLAAILAAACALLCGCHGEGSPYLSSRGTKGTPSDRTGGASDVPYVRGGGPSQDVSPAPGPAHDSSH